MPQSAPSVILRSVGSYLPKRVVSNDELSEFLETSDEWIVPRTGIRERRIAGKEETSSTMACEAAKVALERAGLSAKNIDLIIVASITPDMTFPSTACLVQHKLGCRNIPAFDVQAACSGFVYMLEIGQKMLQSGAYKNALIIGSEKPSSILDWEDRSTAILFGDGAGAAVLSTDETPGYGILATDLGSDGSCPEFLCLPAGGSAKPASTATVAGREHCLKMNGKETFKMAVRSMHESVLRVLEQADVSVDLVAKVIPHQANLRILEALASRMGLPIERFAVSLDRYGNTSAASIPIALDAILKERALKKGDYLVLSAFGAGLTWGSSVIKWHA